MVFGRIGFTYEDLLKSLRRRGDCDVHTVSDLSDIPDTDGSASGALYMVIRGDRDALVEVYHERLPILPDVFRSICVQLGLDEDDLCNPH